MKKILAIVAVLAIVLAVLALVFWDDDAREPSVAGSGEEISGQADTDDASAPPAEDAVALEAEGTEEAVDEALGATQEAAEDTAAELAEAADAVVSALDGEDDATQAEDQAIHPSFDVVRVETSGDAVMAGRAAPGARVMVLSNDGVIAQTQADGNGEWVIVLEEPLAPGSHEIWLRAEGVDGTVTESREAVVMTVPGGDDTAVAQGGDGDAASGETEGGGVLAVTVPREDSDAAVSVLQAPAGGVGIAGGGALTLDSLTYDEDGAVTLSGKADPGSEVRPYVDGEIAGSVQADADGNWSLTLDRNLDAGRHELRVDQVDTQGTVAARLETPIQQAAFTMPSSAEPLVVIQPGNNLWLIARHVYGRGTLYTQIFEANRDQIGDPDLIYPGQIFVLPQAGQTGS